MSNIEFLMSGDIASSESSNEKICIVSAAFLDSTTPFQFQYMLTENSISVFDIFCNLLDRLTCCSADFGQESADDHSMSKLLQEAAGWAHNLPRRAAEAMAEATASRGQACILRHLETASELSS